MAPSVPLYLTVTVPPPLDRAAGQPVRRPMVMRQVGHADSKMTMDVYASCSSAPSDSMARRSTRSCGALVRLYGTTARPHTSDSTDLTLIADGHGPPSRA